MQATIRTVDAVIAALGGRAHAAALCNVVPTAVSNWVARGVLPRDTFVVCTAELARRGLTADPTLWQQRERKRRRNGVKRINVR